MTCALGGRWVHRGRTGCALTCGESGGSTGPVPGPLARSPSGLPNRWHNGRVRLRGAVLLVGLLTGVTLPLAVPASVADPVVPPGLVAAPPAHRASDAISLRLAPPVVTTGEPSLLVTDVTPAKAGRALAVQAYVDAAWVTVAEGATDGRGHAEVALDTATPASTPYRVVADGAGTSRSRTLRVVANTRCSPVTQPVDPEANGEATCLVTRLDRWRRAGLMGVGQQLNVSNIEFMAPLEALGHRPVAVVGFDLEELAQGETYQFPDPPLQALLRLAQQGAVLTASWHATNPGTGGPFTDRGWTNLEALLDETTPAGKRFWKDYDEKLALLARFEDGDGGLFPRTPIVFRPLHEANGAFFWWGKPDPAVYRKLWTRMQARARQAGVHNIVWAYSFNRRTVGVMDPARLLPARVDVGGLDTYDPERGDDNTEDHLWLEGYAAVAGRTGDVPRTALSEVGPHGSRTGSWRPSVITRTVRSRDLTPAWAMLWFDDGNGRDGVSGKKQIGSLDGGLTWLSSCPNGLCVID